MQCVILTLQRLTVHIQIQVGELPIRWGRRHEIGQNLILIHLHRLPRTSHLDHLYLGVVIIVVIRVRDGYAVCRVLPMSLLTHLAEARALSVRVIIVLIFLIIMIIAAITLTAPK